MRCATWALATGIVTALGACSLTTSLDGLSTGNVVIEARDGGDGGDDAAALDARSESSSEAGSGADGSAGTYRDLILSDAPLAYYRLGDQGPIAKDEVGGHDGVYKGTVTHGAGAIAGDANGAATFDGASGYVDAGDVLPFVMTAPFTIEAWTSPVSGAKDPMCVASKSFAQGGLSGSITDGWTFYLDSGTNALNTARYLNGAADTVQGGALPNGRFSHVVTTYDGAKLTIFVDGISVASGASSRSLVSHTQPLTIGASRGGIYCFFRGTLDEVAFYGVALPAARIAAHHAAGISK